MLAKTLSEQQTSTTTTLEIPEIAKGVPTVNSELILEHTIDTSLTNWEHNKKTRN